jgi:hypothetical protein
VKAAAAAAAAAVATARHRGAAAAAVKAAAAAAAVATARHRGHRRTAAAAAAVLHRRNSLRRSVRANRSKQPQALTTWWTLKRRWIAFGWYKNVMLCFSISIQFAFSQVKGTFNAGTVTIRYGMTESKVNTLNGPSGRKVK